MSFLLDNHYDDDDDDDDDDALHCSADMVAEVL